MSRPCHRSRPALQLLERWPCFGLNSLGMSGVNVESDLTSGVGVSKQLSPRLFIKYRVDVWEQTNRLILRYHLNPHWALEGIS